MTSAPTPAESQSGGAKRAPPGWLSPTVDYGPIGVFFGSYWLFDILTATAAMLAATIGTLSLSLALTRRVPMTALITSVMLLVFGGLTLVFQDESYLKLQSTLISSLFSLVLFASLALRWPLLRTMFGTAWPMTDDGWHALTLRFALFFAAMAALNETIARTQSTDLWVDFNVFGTTGLTIAFLAAQWRLLNRHLIVDAGAASTAPSPKEP